MFKSSVLKLALVFVAVLAVAGLGYALLNTLKDETQVSQSEVGGLLAPRETEEVKVVDKQPPVTPTPTPHISDRKVDRVTPPLVRIWADTLGDVSERFIDIETVVVTVDQQAQMTALSISTFGVFPENISNLLYTFCADFDNNSATGGSPASSGIACSIQGVELVGQVQVDVSDGIAQASPTVKKFRDGQFVPVVDQSIRTDIIQGLPPIPGDPPQPGEASPIAELIELKMSNTVRGHISTNFTLEALAENLNTGTVDDVEAEMTSESPTFLE